MTTLASLIDSARYDLVDYDTGIIFSDDELLAYLNRMFEIMDSTLSMLNSDLTKEIEEDIDTVEDQNYVDISSLNDGLWQSISEVWLDQTKLIKISLDRLWRQRKWISSSEKPFFWSLHNQNIIFPGDCDDDYDTLIIQYHTKTGVLLSTDDMPYTGVFNEFLREQLILHSKMKRLGAQSVQGDGMWNAAFKRVAMAEIIARDFIPLPYHIDF